MALAIAYPIPRPIRRYGAPYALPPHRCPDLFYEQVHRRSMLSLPSSSQKNYFVLENFSITFKRYELRFIPTTFFLGWERAVKIFIPGLDPTLSEPDRDNLKLWRNYHAITYSITNIIIIFYLRISHSVVMVFTENLQLSRCFHLKMMKIAAEIRMYS